MNNDIFDIDLLRAIVAPINDSLKQLGDTIAFGWPEVLETLNSPFDPRCNPRTVEGIGEFARERQRELRVRGGRR